jgi:predicted transcriptional regulator
MLPSEMTILMAIAINKNTGQKLLDRPMDVTGEYIGYLYDSLVNRGYLKGRRSAGYHLTATGKEAILEFLSQNGTRARDIMKRLRLLGIGLNPEEEQRVNKFEEEAIKIH